MFYNSKMNEKAAINSDATWILRTPQTFLLRQNIIESFFMRISQTEKLNFILQLCETMSAEITYKWVKYIKAIHFNKIRGYTTLQHMLDKSLFDSNRTISKDTLANTIKEHVEWFRHLDDDTQLFIYITLLRLGGLGLSRNVYWYMRRKNKEQLNKYCDSGITELKTLIDCVSSQFLIRTYKEVLDPNDPHMAEVIKKRKDWKTLMDAYRREIEDKVKKFEGIKKTEKAGGKKDKGKGKGKKDKKKGEKKKSKGKKNSSKKSSSKKSKKNSEKNKCIDFIQLMPNNVVKKILNFLDKKTLAIAAKVNSYWKYAIDSLHADIKARKMLDKVIEMMKKDIKPIEDASHLRSKFTSHKICRFDRMEIEGTCSKSVRKALNEFGGEKYNTSIKQIAVQQLPEYYTMPVYNLGTEIRKVSDESPYDIHWSRKCIKHEAGVKLKTPIDTLEPFGNIAILTRMQIVNPQKSYDSVRTAMNYQEQESQSSFFFQTTETNDNENK